MIKPGEICIYSSPLTDPYKVTFVKNSSEAATSLVFSEWHQREVWVLTKQLEATGAFLEAKKEETIKSNRLILGIDTFPEKKRRKK